MHIQLDAVGGIAGDMFLAAMLDACPEFADSTLAAIDAIGMPAKSSVSIVEHRDHTFLGKRFVVALPDESPHEHHVTYADIVRRLRAAPLNADVCDKALAIFELLAQAEGDVHGTRAEDVTFHEVGAWDSVADIVGAAAILNALRPTTWSLGTLPLGSGRVSTAHGAMPVPAPATAKLLQGFTLVDDGIGGERITPTGAAILKYLRNELGPALHGMRRPITLDRIGTGFGTRQLPGISNVLRVLVFDEATDVQANDVVGVIHFEIDDQTGEDLALGLDALRAREGVLDVLQIPAIGKKGRLVVQLQVLCRHDVLQEIIAECFAQTTTLGLRWHLSARATLAREQVSVGAGNESMRVKLANRPDGTMSAKADVDDTKAAVGHIDRQRQRTDAEQQALHCHATRKS